MDLSADGRGGRQAGQERSRAPFGLDPALTRVPASRWSSDAGREPTTSDVVVDDDTHGLYVLARGSGPEPLRTQATENAAAAVVSLVLRSIALDPRASLEQLARLAVEDANSAVWRQLAEAGGGAGVQVAMTVLLMRHGRLAVGHVGNGRALGLVDGHLVRLTAEHTVAAEHQRRGYPQPEGRVAASTALTRWLGERMFVEVDVRTRNAVLGARYMLLSPGFEIADAEAEIVEIAANRDPDRAVAQMIDRARAAGTDERLSMLLVRPGRKREARPKTTSSSPAVSTNARASTRKLSDAG